MTLTIMAFSIRTLSIMIFCITTFSIMTLSTMTSNIKGLLVTLGVNDIQHK
jgi:hypothetical protein